MSTSQKTDGTDEVTCSYRHCTETDERYTFFKGQYCSSEHHYRAAGADVLDAIADDHRLCATCFAIIRDIVTPSEEWVQDRASRMRAAMDAGAEITAGPGGDLVLDATECDGTKRHVAADAVIGLQSPTENTEIVTDEQSLHDDREWRVRRRGRWGCRCGNIDHREHVTYLERPQEEAVVLNLVRALLVLYHEGTISNRPSKDRLFDALREHGREWDLAIGHAIAD